MGFFRRSSAYIALLGGLCVALFGIAALVAFSSQDEGAADAAAPFDLPPDIPRKDLPKVLDGTTFDAAQVGDWIVVGGDFTRLRLQDGSEIDQVGVFAYNINTGALNPSFLPTLTRKNGDPAVLAVEPTANGTGVYLGGKFNTVAGAAHRNFSRISVTTGIPSSSFAADANSTVRDIVLSDGRLFIGGEFDRVNGKNRGRLAELQPTTGAVRADFRADITESTREIATDPFGPKYLGVTPDNVLVVAHRGNRVDGKVRRGITLIDLNTNDILGWQTSFWGNNMVTTVDAEVSPDGSLLVLGGDGGDFPFIGRDSVVAFDLTNRNQANTPVAWIARMFDSSYAVGVTDDVVYVGGHFCWVESELARDPYPGPTGFSNNFSCHGSHPAYRFAPEVVYRDQVAALDPATGHALLWDPGSDALEGVQSIEVIDRGLLIGHDGDRFGRDGAKSRAWNVGRHVFIDRNQPSPNSSAFIDVPVVGLCDGRQPTITGTTRNDSLVGTYGNDVILAGPGHDYIDGGGGNDRLCGGDGNDVLRGGDGNDRMFGDGDRDRLFGGDGADRMLGGTSIDVLAGERGADTLIGGKGADRMNGGAGIDIVKGGPGPDRAQGGRGADTVDGGIGNDRCAGWSLGQPDNPGDVLTTCP
ncbi:MAG: hypothetical protein HKN94_06315 [Acidimicrobiales bacterium]|nr:hypothetical protein [Acidimicrobiales bacterium]